MTRPRSQLISLESTPYYHCISRCVRRAFLCGDDSYTQQNFDHRKAWVIKRLKLLGELFSIDIAAYAIMSNHYHLVLHIDKDRSLKWTKKQIFSRWLRLYKGPLLIHRYLQDEKLSAQELDIVDSIAEVWRERLASISWFMACMNEYIARKANKEDNCKGRFWESRFKSQALLDDTALISCMAYVDLNPVRAAIADKLNTSDFTSIQVRLKQEAGKLVSNQPRLMPMSQNKNLLSTGKNIPYNKKDYFDLVQWTKCHIKKQSQSIKNRKNPALLDTLRLSQPQWHSLVLDIQKRSILLLNGIDALNRISKTKSFKKVS